MQKIIVLISMLTVFSVHAAKVQTYVKDIECTGKSSSTPYQGTEYVGISMSTYKVSESAKNYTLRISMDFSDEKIEAPVFGESEPETNFDSALRRLNNQVVSFSSSLDIKLTIYEDENGVQKLYGKYFVSDFETYHYDLECTAKDFK